MKKLVLASACYSLIALSACSQQKGFSVKGTIKGMENQSLFLASTSKSDAAPKKVQLDAKGAFEVRDTVSDNEPALYELVDATQGRVFRNGAMMGVRVSFLAQNGDKLLVSGTKDELQWASVSGNKYGKEFADYNAATADLQIQAVKNWKQYGALMRKRNPANQPQMDSIANVTEAIEVKSRDQILQFVKDHPSYTVSAIVLSNLAYTAPADKTEAALNALAPAIKQSKFAAPIMEALGQKKASADASIGKDAVEFAKKDINGNTLRLSDFKGKYVLLDFWGSWCGACRASHPHLKKLYEEYKDQGFVVIGVAEERTDKKDAWLKAIQKDGLPWLQILNEEGKENVDVVKLYGVNAFPTKILIDKDGKIILKTIGTSGGGSSAEEEGAATTGGATAAPAGSATANSSGITSSASKAVASTASAGAATTAGKSNIPTRKSPEEELDEKLKEVFGK